MLAKARVYDAMHQMEWLATAIWWVIHMLYLPLCCYGFASAFLWDREIFVVNGNMHCVNETTMFTMSVFIVVSTLISLSCVVGETLFPHSPPSILFSSFFRFGNKLRV
jgi:hypothetical protein